MRRSILKIKDIVLEEKLYPRIKPNEAIINSYIRDMKKGDSFPPLYIGLFKGKNYLLDGWHRLEAYESLGDKYVNCEIKTTFTDFDDMFLAAFRANMAHGIRLNKNDKMRVANILSEMKYDVGDISKLTGITLKKIESAVKGKIQHVLIKNKIKSGQMPEIIRDKIPYEWPVKIIEDKTIKKIEEANKEEFQLFQLNEIYDYIKNEDFDLENKKIDDILRKMKKLLHKRFPKL